MASFTYQGHGEGSRSTMEELPENPTCRGRSVRDDDNTNSCNLAPCPVCELCGTLGNLRVCAGCKGAWYCSKEHQVSDWSKHKSLCKSRLHGKKPKAKPTAERVNGSATGTLNQAGHEDPLCVSAERSPHDTGEVSRSGKECMAMGNIDHPVDPLGIDIGTTSTESGRIITSALSTDSSQGSESSASVPESNITSRSVQVIEDSMMTFSDKLKAAEAKPSNNMPKVCSQGKRIRSRQRQKIQKQALQKQETEKAEDEVTSQLEDYVVRMLNEYGICVMDKFMGEVKGTQILNDVRQLHQSGAFQDGQVVSKTTNQRKIRGDQITWIERGEAGMDNISMLIARLDKLIMACNGKLKNCNIHGRTKAMVACYPGNGTYYMKHVDNPNEDGRVITCIYYLNKSWVKEHGGLLQIFPAHLNWVAAVEPKFDRVLFFWSDRRNPHQVMESHFTRFAVTVWYFDAAEREKAKLRFQTTGERQGDARTMSTELGLEAQLSVAGAAYHTHVDKENPM